MGNKLFGNKKPVVYVIVAFVIALFTLFAIKAEGSELSAEAGSAVVRGETPTLGINLYWPDTGPVGTDYELGFNLVGQSSGHESNPNTIIIRGMLWDGYKRFSMGLGFAYTNVDQEYTCRFTFAMGLRIKITDRISAQARHFSSAGSCQPNVGRDLLTVAWRF
jgi:hypothetical protein